MADIEPWGLPAVKLGPLRELRAPRDLRPVGSRAIEVAPGLVERRHRIPLRYHPGAWLIVAVTVHRSGHPRYDAWVWHPGRRSTTALWWDEARRNDVLRLDNRVLEAIAHRHDRRRPRKGRPVGQVRPMESGGIRAARLR